MRQVTIKFASRKLEITDEGGKKIEATRAVVYLVAGNDVPVALIEMGGQRHEVPVRSLQVMDVAPVITEADIIDEVMPTPKKGEKP